MKIITLVENTTISSKCKSKHGICFYIETLKHKILFNIGSNALFLENANNLGVDIKAVDTVIISHGHKDHGGALKPFLDNNKTAKIYIRETAFLPYYTKVLGLQLYVGLDCALKKHEQIILTGEHYIIDDELQLFSGITERECFSTINNVLYMKKDNEYQKDTFQHEQNFVITQDNQSVLFAGCAHNGIVNILNKAEKINKKPLNCTISGFHLYNPVTHKCESDIFIKQVAKQLSSRPTEYYTCHCTGKKVFDVLYKTMGKQIKYLATGSVVVI